MLAVVSKAVLKRGKLHEATKIFQALRIKVNEELENLDIAQKKAFDILATGGHLAIISFHSLEDRMVKIFMKSGNTEGKIEKDLYGKFETPFKIITKKPITPSEEEISSNTRARSAKLRVAERV